MDKTVDITVEFSADVSIEGFERRSAPFSVCVSRRELTVPTAENTWPSGKLVGGVPRFQDAPHMEGNRVVEIRIDVQGDDAPGLNLVIDAEMFLRCAKAIEAAIG
jgi:hypothetical protein